MNDVRVAVVGATGFTGKLTVAELHGRGVPVRAVGRNASKLEELAGRHPGIETRVVSWDEGSLASAFDGCSAVVSCAGPFAEIGKPVVEAAIRARVPYCDSTGEQVFIRWVFEECDAPARAAGIAVLPACGFDYVPGNLGAAILAAEIGGPLERIDVVYGTESAATSVGTRVSSVGVMTSPGVALQDGALRPSRIGSLRRSVDLGFARMTGGVIPTGEVFQVPRHVDVQTVVGYLALPGRVGPAAPGAGLLGAALKVPGAAALMKSMARRGIEGPSEGSRGKRVGCHVQAVGLDGTRKAVLVEGTDAYGFTARCLAELAVRLSDGVDAVGACAPAQVVAAPEFLSAAGYTVRSVPPE